MQLARIYLGDQLGGRIPNASRANESAQRVGVFVDRCALGPQYLSASFLERVYLLWTIRNFTILPVVVLSRRQQELVNRLCAQQKFVCLPFENGVFEQPLIGTVEGACLPCVARRRQRPRGTVLGNLRELHPSVVCDRGRCRDRDRAPGEPSAVTRLSHVLIENK